MHDLLIDVVHGIQKDVGVMPRVENHTLSHDVPTLLVAMKFVDMVPPYSEAIVTLSNVEHMTGHVTRLGLVAK